MGSNLGGDGDDHLAIIKIWEVNKDWLASMQRKILSQSAGGSSCCIFKVPPGLKQVNPEHYQPQMVSIGPYHHGKHQLAKIEEHKWRFLGILLQRTEKKGLNLEHYLRAVQPLEDRARKSYSEPIHFSQEKFLEMLVLDGCFIIELFRKIGGVVSLFDPDDQLCSMLWKNGFLRTDLILLENQIPFFVLDSLFELTELQDVENRGHSLRSLTLNFFEGAFEGSKGTLARCSSDIEDEHILAFVRSSYISTGLDEPMYGEFHNIRAIQCISSLRRAGIDFKPGKDGSFLAVKFSNGVLEMPPICLYDSTGPFLMNCVAYEQCDVTISDHITAYVALLDSLVNTARDVQFLCDRKIIENYLGSDAEVAKFVNKTGKNVAISIETCYLASVFEEVNQYYDNNWHVQWASFKDRYFNTPWSLISALAAFVLLVLTLLQTIYTMLSYVKSN